MTERIAAAFTAGLLLASPALASATDVTPPATSQRWTDDQLIAGYEGLKARAELDVAIRNPALPSDAADPSFLGALAWFAAGNPDHSGSLTLPELDEFLDTQVAAYRGLLAARVDRGEDNSYPRTRTWKLIQKLTLLRNVMTTPPRAGEYPYPETPRVSAASDPWEQAHTVRSTEEFADKVCKGSFERPVLVKFGNTNCTQCMLFEMIGTVKAFAERPDHRNLDVYKVWWGYRPDASFAAKMKDPARLDDLVKAEGVRSSPTFVVYRNGRRYPCGGPFPDASGKDERLDSCLQAAHGDAPLASVCAPKVSAQGPAPR